jgi:hypothetical protein
VKICIGHIDIDPDAEVAFDFSLPDGMRILGACMCALAENRLLHRLGHPVKPKVVARAFFEYEADAKVRPYRFLLIRSGSGIEIEANITFRELVVNDVGAYGLALYEVLDPHVARGLEAV